MRRTIRDEERRARLVARHHLGRTAGDVGGAVRGLVALHSSDPATPYLSCRARMDGFTTEHLDHALYEARTLWRLHAMRRTLFVVPADRQPVLHAGAARDVAASERRRVQRWLAAEMDEERVDGWLSGVEDRVAEVLAVGGEWRTADVAAAVPELATEITVGSGRWATRAPLSSRLLFLLAIDGRVVRTRPAGGWRSSQYRWAATAAWFGRVPDPLDTGAARAALARDYLAAYGPATVTDLRWWTGWTARQARAALDAAAVETVTLQGGGEGFVVAGDVEPADVDAGGVALLPGLDPTPMGWKERSWYLGDHAAPLFDRNGNVGPTVWAGGRVVGGWAQRPDGEVVVRLLDQVDASAADRVDAEAAELAAWLDGTVVTPRFRTPLERGLSRVD